MKTDESSIYIDSGAVAVINLLKLFEKEISIAKIKSLFVQEWNGPGSNLQDIKRVLSRLQIETFSYQIDNIDILFNFGNPFISWLNITGRATSFICMVDITAQGVKYLDECSLLVNKTIEEFLATWSGAILVANPAQAEEDSLAFEEENNGILQFKNAIKVVDNFLVPAACDEIVQLMGKLNLFSRSKVAVGDEKYTDVGSGISPYRTSETARINTINDLPGLDDLYKKIEATLNVPRDKIENLQCTKYPEHSFFSPHFDTGKEFSNPRKFTMILYLNDDFLVGETYFPELRFKIQPQKGRAVFFDNLLPDELLINPYSLHAGLPVLSGIKYICTTWTRTNNILQKD